MENIKIENGSVIIDLPNGRRARIIVTGDDLMILNIPGNEGGKIIEVYHEGLNMLRLKLT